MVKEVEIQVETLCIGSDVMWFGEGSFCASSAFILFPAFYGPHALGIAGVAGSVSEDTGSTPPNGDMLPGNLLRTLLQKPRES